MVSGSEEKPPLPPPTPSTWTDLQRTAWLQMAVSQQRAWLLERLNQSSDRTTQVIEESCKAMEARLLQAAGCAIESVGTCSDAGHDVTDKMLEPRCDPPPDPPIDLTPPDSQVPRSGSQRTLQQTATAPNVGRRVAWPGNVNDGDVADDPEPEPGTTLKREITMRFRIKSETTHKLQSERNQIQQLIGTHPGAAHGIDPQSFRGRLHALFQGGFDAFVGFLIILNTIIMFVQLQYYGQVANASLGLDHSDWAHAESVFHGLEMFFSALFLVELISRLYVYRCGYFHEAFNVLDAIVVPLTALNTFLISYLEMTFSNTSFIRMLRMFRVVRAFRVVRTMGRFKELRLLMHTIVHSFLALFWSMLVMFIFVLMTAILLCQSLQEFIADPTEDLEMRLWVNQYYGDGLKSLYTVFEMTFSGCWPNYVRPLIERVHPLFAVVFVIYITAVVFAMTRIVSALFLKETLQSASHVAEMMVKEKANDTKVIMSKFRALFMAADTSCDGQLTRDELIRVLRVEKVKLWLAKIGVDASDPEALFDLLDADGSGSISTETFLTCVKRLKGEARAQDLIPVVQDCKQILHHCKALRDDHRHLSTLLKHKEQEESPS